MQTTAPPSAREGLRTRTRRRELKQLLLLLLKEVVDCLLWTRRGGPSNLRAPQYRYPRPARTGRVGFRLASGVAPWGDLRQALLLDCVLLACFVALGLGFTTRVTRQWSDNLALQPNDTEKLAPRHCRCEFASRPGRWTILRLEILKGDLLLRNMSRTAKLQE